MHGRNLWLMVALAAVVLVAGCGQSAGAVNLDERSNGTSVTLQRGTKLVLKLQSNPTTGYDWYLSGALPSMLATASDAYATGASGTVVGAGGVHTFVYSTGSAGSGELKLVYIRPWETGVAPQETFAITVQVK